METRPDASTTLDERAMLLSGKYDQLHDQEPLHLDEDDDNKMIAEARKTFPMRSPVSMFNRT